VISPRASLFELNLMPRSSIQRQEFAQKKPYLIAAVFSLALSIFLLHSAEARLASGLNGNLQTAQKELNKIDEKSKLLKSVISDRDAAIAAAQAVTNIASSHLYWMKMFDNLRRSLVPPMSLALLLLALAGAIATEFGVISTTFAAAI